MSATTREPDGDVNAESQSNTGMRLRNKVVVFLGFPMCMGMGGMSLAYLDIRYRPSNNGRQISFDRDFVMPFLLALAMVVILYVQTNGFRPGQAVQPIVAWPKVKRVRKIVHKTKTGQVMIDNTTTKDGSTKDGNPKEDSLSDKKTK